MSSTTRQRLNLSDAVDDLAPPPPKCFLNRTSWREYLKSAAAAQNQKGEPTVILFKNGEPRFNYEFPLCNDCTQVKSVEMMAKDRCEPQFLTILAAEEATQADKPATEAP